MGSSMNTAVTLVLIFSLSFLPSKSVGYSMGRENIDSRNQVKKVLGSRPPQCLNKCLNCRPCIAALVVPPHRKNDAETSSEEDENYYLLTWKCKCGDKMFQP
ncbi:hypothetical protein RJ641_026212 [Dillenia turbinata]|uniref:Epidermal patterning factor-like protein n=1 Tax=Dillenia turbinata TaxID=194707 RepID=A0AAN8W301_9MAGN